MYPAYARWVQSHRDLPIKLNQWNNVVVWSERGWGERKGRGGVRGRGGVGRDEGEGWGERKGRGEVRGRGGVGRDEGEG